MIRHLRTVLTVLAAFMVLGALGSGSPAALVLPVCMLLVVSGQGRKLSRRLGPHGRRLLRLVRTRKQRHRPRRRPA